MSLFNWFGKKEPPTVTAKSLVWMHAAARQKGVLQLMQKHSNSVLVAWFPETQRQWQTFMQQQGFNNKVMIARQINAVQLVNKMVILLEHYPLASKESAFLESLHSDSILITSSLDEPLFNYFGGDRISKLLEGMGMNGDEAIEHELVTSAIRNAQRKLEKNVLMEQTANSMQEWFDKNGRK